MTDKPSGHLPRLLTREQAAAYCGYSPSGFSRLVAMGALPGPVPGLSRWDKRAIDDRLDKISGIENSSEDDGLSAYDKWKQETSADDELDEWSLATARRKAAWPQHNLNARQEQALRALGVNDPTPQPSAGIRGVGDKTFEELIGKKLASEHTLDEDGDRTFVQTDMGREEFQRHLVRDQER